ncbi:MAG: DNA methyltransferase, partial [Thermoanaerobaculia bacterium]
MFPPDFVKQAVLIHTRPGDLVFDPFSGRGTTLLEASLLGRRAIASDLNPVAFCISAAKAKPPQLGRLLRFIDELEEEYSQRGRERSDSQGALPEFFSVAFHRSTLSQILFLRRRLQWRSRVLDRFVAALLLAQLHGEVDHSPNFFSNQMPHTISTKPAYSIRYWRRHRLAPPRRDVFQILKAKAAFRLACGTAPAGVRVRLADVRRVARAFPSDHGCVSTVITSPPYLDVTAFEEDQWLRLWFLGGPPRPTWGLYSRDDRHRSDGRYWQFLKEAWVGISPLLKSTATIVCRVGSLRFSVAELEAKLRTSLKGVWSQVRLLDG